MTWSDSDHYNYDNCDLSKSQLGQTLKVSDVETRLNSQQPTVGPPMLYLKEMLAW